MSVKVACSIVCDLCGRVLTLTDPLHVRNYRLEAGRRGWRCRDKDTCNVCRQEQGHPQGVLALGEAS